jgi:hypothetical protein
LSLALARVNSDVSREEAIIFKSRTIERVKALDLPSLKVLLDAKSAP